MRDPTVQAQGKKKAMDDILKKLNISGVSQNFIGTTENRFLKIQITVNVTQSQSMWADLQEWLLRTGD